jgi:hypothetical protein
MGLRKLCEKFEGGITYFLWGKLGKAGKEVPKVAV